jgi:hypothetical protein
MSQIINLTIKKMANYEKGILGPFTGLVGTVVGVTWRGKSIMRSRPKKTAHVPTVLQERQHMKFTIAMHFLTPLRSVLNRYFGNEIGAKSRFNMATSYTINNALEWTGGEFELLFSKVLISKGELQGLQNPTTTTAADQEFNFTWVNNTGQGLALANDQLLVVFYCPEFNLYEVYEDVTDRADENATLTLPSLFAGQQVHVWATFISHTHKKQATSSYLGEFVVL